ncbi:hypothetical protein [Paenibacillus sp. GP183]|jgi:hypothetical protein|uniref:hypothetical protein n=1 Tax=Paenibacillus sp. GP183 TaxID=1882751 RepID=UPI00089443F6|nr:hypothetical protein [Paenibacillus sp. GP183]SEC44357.1 micrococcal nuclease [Paenibacillus sp. GP183]
MKKLRYAALSLVLILSLTACSTANKPTSAQPAATTTSPSPSTQHTTVTTSPSPSAQPSATQSTVSTPNSSNASATIAATPKPTTKATPKEETAVVKILSVTSPAARNSTATLKANVAPGATASIVVHYKSGPSTAAGLESKKADSDGNVSWSWHVGGNTTLGNWGITVSSGNSSAETTFEVVH